MAGDNGNPIATVLLVGAVAAGAALMVSASYDFSKDRIAANERARLLESLNSVLDPALHDRDLQTVRLTATDPDLLGDDEPVDVFVALDGTQAVATIFASVAPHGYNAPIRLLIGVSPAAAITGVRAVRHRETPGLGDRIETGKSSWIRQFDAKSLQMPPVAAWSIDEEEEGAFDALTGATVTSRAVVNAVKGTLLYFEQHRDELYASARQTLQATDAATE